MRHNAIAIMLLLAATLPAVAAKKDTGTTTLKDFQPAGTTDKKHKHQQYDMTFTTSTNDYTCRTNEGAKINATDFVVGSSINYQVSGNKGKVKNLSSGKQVSCTIVRVADASMAQPK